MTLRKLSELNLLIREDPHGDFDVAGLIGTIKEIKLAMSASNRNILIASWHSRYDMLFLHSNDPICTTLVNPEYQAALLNMKEPSLVHQLRNKSVEEIIRAFE